MAIRKVTQLELENFVSEHDIAAADESGRDAVLPLTAADVRIRAQAAHQALKSYVEDGNGDADWADTYHDLINAGWPWRMAAWVAWSTMPKSRRWPKSQEELATNVLGLTSDRVIATWRKKHPTLDQLIADLQASEMLDTRADVLRALKVSASDVDYKHSPDRRIYLTMTGDYSENKKLEITRKAKSTVRDMSDAELDALSGDPAKIKELMRQLQGELQDDEELSDDYTA
ncbi:MAG TPA: hypothetical protein DCG54_07575 [Anaerolineae bacterium]|jgi:hypothetical protein|nr:hypothetical protein [Anaerolineae bacterium]